MISSIRPRGALAAALAADLGTGAAAQDAGPSSGWSFDLAPYVWVPSLDARLRYDLPSRLGGSADVRADPDDYLAELSFALAFVATLRHERLSVFTDLVYVSADSGSSRLEAADIIGVGRNPISSSVNLAGNSTLKTTLWTLAGGYTVASGASGHVDVLAGFRYLGIEATTDYNLAVTLLGPAGNAGPSFGGAGRLSGRDDIWNGILGVRGRIRLTESGFFIPYHLDIGTGNSRSTWNGFTGIGYQAGRTGVQLGWRYMSFDQGGNSLAQEVSLSGAYLAVNVRF